MVLASALVLIGDGFDDAETVIVVDILRRGQVRVTIASVDGIEVTGERGVTIKADKLFSQCKDNVFDVFILPGGTASCMTLKKIDYVGVLLKKHFRIGKLIAAATQAPAVLDKHSVGHGRKITSTPIHEYKLTDYKHTKRDVEYDGNIITSKGPGIAHEFAFKILSVLKGNTYVDDIKKDIVYRN